MSRLNFGIIPFTNPSSRLEKAVTGRRECKTHNSQPKKFGRRKHLTKSLTSDNLRISVMQAQSFGAGGLYESLSVTAELPHRDRLIAVGK